MKIYRIPMVPGPVSVSREVLEAGQENFGSADLEKEYIDLYKATEKSLRKIMQTKNSVVIQTGEGMLALWSALKSCLLPIKCWCCRPGFSVTVWGEWRRLSVVR